MPPSLILALFEIAEVSGQAGLKTARLQKLFEGRWIDDSRGGLLQALGIGAEAIREFGEVRARGVRDASGREPPPWSRYQNEQ